ncbi:MAG: nucleoside triphosphate pyrophosphohydrolase [Chloroflexota bacterium]
MTIQVFNKLVRDKIPEIISADGRTPVTSELNDTEYVQALKNKLNEEVAEFQDSDSLEELADILEVVYALAKACGSDQTQIENIRMEKTDKRGGFVKKIFLERVESG